MGKRLLALGLIAIPLALAGCVTGHDGVDMVTSVAANTLLWGVP